MELFGNNGGDPENGFNMTTNMPGSSGWSFAVGMNSPFRIFNKLKEICP
jgi:hypothetical protein